MAKLPLLFHFQPRVGTGPTVMLAQGRYKFESDHSDSELTLHLPYGYHQLIGDLILEKDTKVQIHITKKGTEKEISIYAVEI